MATAAAEYVKLIAVYTAKDGVAAGQMFGKPCLKINGKAFVSHHKETIVFKLSGLPREKALSLKGAALWDPSGKGRPMKEWIALPDTYAGQFQGLANAALAYVSASK